MTEKTPPAIEVLFHNVGHHDVCAVLAGEEQRSRKIPNVKTYSFASRVNAAVAAGAPWEVADGVGDGSLSFLPPLQLWSRREAVGLFGEDLPAGAPGGLAAVQLALLPAVVARWLKQTSAAQERRLILLHSGYDSEVPMLSGPSTLATAELIASWVRRRYPAIRVECVRSKVGDPFRFAQDAGDLDELGAVLDGLREAAAAFGTGSREWRQELGVGLSASTGTDAVIWTLAAQLMPYHPTMYHVPQARRAAPLAQAHEVEVSDHHVFRGAPPRSAASLPVDASALREAMTSWRDDYRRAWGEQGDVSELRGFWLRKSKQPVLAVLMTRGADGTLRFHRGCNLEVSMPTGSLCAERNAIGSALAENPGLARLDMLGVAVLSLTPGANPIDPCGACEEWIGKIVERSPGFTVMTFADETCEAVHVRRPI